MRLQRFKIKLHNVLSSVKLLINIKLILVLLKRIVETYDIPGFYMKFIKRNNYLFQYYNPVTSLN